MTTLAIGILGCARIACQAIVSPAKRLAGKVTVAAVASRDPARAAAYANRHGIARACGSYQELIQDPAINLVYNPLPNSLHAEWSIRALEAGKHVLCEKPMACNAAEARRMADAAAASGRLLIEAFHYRHHPLLLRMKEIVASGELGDLREMKVDFCVPLWKFSDIRYNYELGGGATMDLGCYCVNMLRWLAAAEPQVTGARAKIFGQQIDRRMEATFVFPDGVTGGMKCSLWSSALLHTRALIRGTKGEIRVLMPFQPHYFHKLKVSANGESRVENFSSERTYYWQLRAVAAAVRGETAVATNAEDAVANMRVIDDIYLKARLRPRGIYY